MLSFFSFVDMKTILNSKYLLPLFLILLTVVNIIQGYSTELLADEAYYWTYSNFLDWGYFDHPPMVAVWISISKLLFSDGEISVRFLSALTLSVTYYIIWQFIEHKQKEKFTWLYILLISSTALFTVYGFITVPDTPLLFFFALFLLGYKKYISKQSLLSYIILSIAMAGMLYSKYQGVLIILFVLLSNIKVLKDGKIWLTALATVLLFSPHIYWQFINDFASFKYHLFERSSKSYRLDFTTNHFLNLIAIIGFTFPVVYMAFFKRLHVKNAFEKALRYIVIGFAVFFFISSFKNHVQAQWVLPISISLIVITFYFLIEHQNYLKLFKILAFISIGVLIILRIIIANDGILPKQFEMHGNKKWVANLDEKIGDRTPLFLNSYQNTSTYWFYSGKRPNQYNSWDSRKNQYDLYDFNQNYELNNVIEIGIRKNQNPTDSVIKRNNGKLYFKDIIGPFSKNTQNKFSITSVSLKENSKNFVPVSYDHSNIQLKMFSLFIVLRDHREVRIYEAQLNNDAIHVHIPKFDQDFQPKKLQIIGKLGNETKPIRLSDIEKIKQ